ncbi:unnamed protein product [Blumeria hordei]|uniref:Uncharacterized protein n=1 Tax=Blumeria hordei TaxID=2867405 RepID=A0A383UKT6_BLUHO|nr:unnamed protein product [Blumeria hordei]
MKCIYAMLLLQNSISKIQDRIVFTGSNIIINVERIYTEVYKPFDGGFPKPEDGSGIFMAIDESRTPGTHHAIYCSKDMLFTDMMSKIVAGSQPLSDEEIIHLDKDNQAVQECYNYLQYLQREVDAVNPPMSSTTLAIVWYQGKVHLLQKCRGNKSTWYFVSNFNYVEFPLNLSITLKNYNESVGRSESLVERGELSVRWNLRKKLGAVGPHKEYPYRTKVKLIQKPQRPQTVPGVLVDKYSCAS